MSIESDAERLGFFAVDDFGVDTVCNGAKVKGIFMNGSEDLASPFGGPDVVSSRPQLIARTSDIDASGLNTTTTTAVKIASVAYTAREIHPDGTGITVIDLHEVI